MEIDRGVKNLLLFSYTRCRTFVLQKTLFRLFENIIKQKATKVNRIFRKVCKLFMCNVCLKNPCDARCPHAPEPKSVFVCSGCGRNIYDGDDYYEIMGEQFCEKCISDAKKEAEYDPY